MGIFGSKFVADNIVSVLCTVLSAATVFGYQVWRTQRKIRKDTNEINQGVIDLVRSRSPYTVIAPKISGELAESLKGAKEWSFRGGSGRWQRECVLPQLSEERNRAIPYNMLIIDPTEPDLCRQYADYRNKHRVDGSVSTNGTVRNEILACIVACAWYSRMTRIAARVYLTQTYSPLRQDMSSRMVAVTVSDKSQSGLFVPHSSWYYESLRDEFNEHCARSPEVQFAGTENLPSDWRALTSGDVKSVLRSTKVRKLDGTLRKLCESPDLSAESLEEIRQLVFKGRHA